MVLQRVGTYGALLGSLNPSSGVVGQVSLPRGGLLVVDLLRPDRYVHLELDPANLDSGLGARIQLLHAAGSIRPEDLDLPPEWVRAAVVDGVVRWSAASFDEDLLRADQALALADLGDQDGAAALYARARLPLMRLARGRIIHEAVRTELRRIVAAAPDDYGITVPVAGGQTFEESEIGRLVRSRNAGARLKYRGSTRGFGVDQPDATDPDPIEVLVDPLHVVSRLCVGLPTATRVGDGMVEVTWPANDHVVMSTPAARRLQVWAVDTSGAADEVDAKVIGIAPMVLEGDDFRGRLRVPDQMLDALVLVPRDASVRMPPRVDAVGRAEIAALASMRDAADAQRRIAVADALGDISGSGDNDRMLALNAAGAALVEAGRELPAGIDRGAPPVLRPAYPDAARPLLAELVAGAS